MKSAEYDALVRFSTPTASPGWIYIGSVPNEAMELQQSESLGA